MRQRQSVPERCFRWNTRARKVEVIRSLYIATGGCQNRHGTRRLIVCVLPCEGGMYHCAGSIPKEGAARIGDQPQDSASRTAASTLHCLDAASSNITGTCRYTGPCMYVNQAFLHAWCIITNISLLYLGLCVYRAACAFAACFTKLVVYVHSVVGTVLEGLVVGLSAHPKHAESPRGEPSSKSCAIAKTLTK